MQRCRPEVVTAGRLKSLGVKLGVAGELAVDNHLDAALRPDLGQELTEDAITEPMNLLDPAAELHVGHHLGGYLADGAEFATFGRGCWAPHQKPPSPAKAKPEAL
jgi:hypothetical protein